MNCSSCHSSLERGPPPSSCLPRARASHLQLFPSPSSRPFDLASFTLIHQWLPVELSGRSGRCLGGWAEWWEKGVTRTVFLQSYPSPLIYTGDEHLKEGFHHIVWRCKNPQEVTSSQYRGFHKLKDCGNPVLSESVGIIFPTAFAHFMSLCQILVILVIFQTFTLLYLLWWTVISDLWCDYYDSSKTQMMGSFSFSFNIF